tara:strand:+ start:150 stop:368 length:219 start_codon:yes stop_codon:yes gene_type:complete
MKNLPSHLLFEPAFLWQLFLQYAHFFVRESQNNVAKVKKVLKGVYLGESDTIHSVLACIVEQNGAYKRNKHI